MRWISFILGVLALGILFGVAHQGVRDWVEAELRIPRSVVATDVSMSVLAAGDASLARFVRAREDLASLVAARLAKGELSTEAALEELELGLPGVSAAVLRRGGRELARRGTPTFEAAERPQTAIVDEALVVSRAVENWQVTAAFQLVDVFGGIGGPQSALLRWQLGDRSLAQLGPSRLAASRAEAERLGGVASQQAPVAGTRLEVIALPPASRLVVRLQEAVLGLGLGVLGILALTVLLAPSGAAREASPVPEPSAESSLVTTPGAAASAASAHESREEPATAPGSAPLSSPSRETDDEAAARQEAEWAAPTDGGREATAPADGAPADEAPADETPPGASSADALSEARMAGLGFGARGEASLTDEDGEDEGEDEAAAPVPHEPMHSASLPSVRPGSDVDDEDGDGWSPALAESKTEPGSSGRAWPVDSTKGPVPQPRDASLIAGPGTGDQASEAVEPFDPQHYQEVYEAFVAARVRVGAPASGVSMEAFSRKLETSERGLIEKHGCRAVRFEVVEREGKVTLRPQLVR